MFDSTIQVHWRWRGWSHAQRRWGGGGDAEESSDSCDKVFDDSKRGHPESTRTVSYTLHKRHTWTCNKRVTWK